MKIKEIYIPSISKTILYWIGSNASDNFQMIDDANINDIWFHIHNQSSCHVIGRIPDDLTLNKKQLRHIVTQGAVICKHNSKFASSSKLEIVYAKIQDVEKTEVVGRVQTQNSHIITI